MTSRPDFIFGNTRLRARLPTFLTARDYGRMTGLSFASTVTALRTTAYGTYIDRAEPSAPAVLDAITSRLRDLLRGVRNVYAGEAGHLVGVLLARHDLADCIALLRGARTGQLPVTRLEAIMAVGSIDDQAAADVAAAADGAVAAARLSARRLPDPITARILPALWERFAVNADPDQFEASVATTAIEGWIGTLFGSQKQAGPVLNLVRAECDRANLLTALRVSHPRSQHLLPCGLLERGALGRPEDIRAAIATVRPEWSAALNQYADTHDRVTLESSVDAAIWRQTLRQLRRGDPLGAAVPTAFVVTAECEARNVRLLIGAAQRTAGTDLGPLLVA